MSGYATVRRLARNAAARTSSAGLLVCLGAAVLTVWAIAQTLELGIKSPSTALTFAALIAVGELVRITYPADRVQSPIAWSGGMAYALLCLLPSTESAPRPVAQTVTVAAVGMLAGAAPHGLAGRPTALEAIARRVLVVGLVSYVYCNLVEGRWASPAGNLDLGIGALLMLAMLVIAYLADCLLRAVSVVSRTHASLPRQFVIETQVAPGIDASMVATAVSLAIATNIMGHAYQAVPLFSIPLLLTQSAYRHFNAARATYAQTIAALSRATELAGFTVVGHGLRVATLSVALGEALGVGPHELKELEHAALLHDLGQMTLAEPLPGGATVALPIEDRVRIANAGAELIQEAQIPGKVGLLVGRQAEPYPVNGSVRGQPLLAARIIAVANAYDDLAGGHLTADGLHQVVQQISLRSGVDYDPKVVEALKRHVSRGTGGGGLSQAPLPARG